MPGYRKRKTIQSNRGGKSPKFKFEIWRPTLYDAFWRQSVKKTSKSVFIIWVTLCLLIVVVILCFVSGRSFKVSTPVGNVDVNPPSANPMPPNSKQNNITINNTADRGSNIVTGNGNNVGQPIIMTEKSKQAQEHGGGGRK